MNSGDVKRGLPWRGILISVQNVLHRLRLIHWSGPRVLALIVALFGTYGVISSVGDIARSAPPSLRLVPNPVFGHPERPEPAQAMAQLARGYPGNFGTAVFFSLFVVLLGANFFHVLRNLYPHAALRALLAGLFLAGAVLCGFIVVLTVLKISEFAVQAAAVGGEPQAWLRGGINFMFQLHVIFASTFFLCLGWGWVLMGWAASAVRPEIRWFRSAALVLLLAGCAEITAVLDRAWLPAYGPKAPALAVFLSREAFQNTALVWGLLASGVLGWLGVAERPATRVANTAM